MIELRRLSTLAHADFGWLKSRQHITAFRTGAKDAWGSLVMWNDDEIAPGTGFPMHPHRDLEIVTYVFEGAVTHRDDTGGHGRIEAGDVQVMSAGSGIQHSEYNDESGTTRIFQIWLMPGQRGRTPSFGTRPFPKAERQGRFSVLASGDASDERALRIHADAKVLAASLRAGEAADYLPSRGRHLYLVPTQGSVTVNGQVVGPRDGLAVLDEPLLRIEAHGDVEVLLVDAA